MKKVVFILCGYYIPSKNYGGPTTSIETIVNACSDEFEFRIVVANHDLREKEKFKNISEGWNKVGNAQVLYINDNEYTVKNLKRLFIKYNASLVYLAGVFNIRINWHVLFVGKLLGIPVLDAPRGELCKNTFAMKKYKKAPFIKFVNFLGLYKNAYFQATSEEEFQGIKNLMAIKTKNIFLVPNLPKTIFLENISKKEKGKLRIVFISRIQEKKNLITAIKAVKGLKSEVIFDIYGPMESPEYWNKCQMEIVDTKPNVKIEYCGALDPTNVPETFRKYDCFIFPTLSENYGHVIVEALMNGCSVILSKGTTPWDDLDKRAGFACDLNKLEQFTEALESISAMGQKQIDLQKVKIKEYLNEKINISEIAEQHKSMFRKSISKEGNI